MSDLKERLIAAHDKYWAVRAVWDAAPDEHKILAMGGEHAPDHEDYEDYCRYRAMTKAYDELEEVRLDIAQLAITAGLVVGLYYFEEDCPYEAIDWPQIRIPASARVVGAGDETTECGIILLGQLAGFVIGRPVVEKRQKAAA